MKVFIFLLILLKYAHCKIIDYNYHIKVIDKIVNNETNISELCIRDLKFTLHNEIEIVKGEVFDVKN